MKGRVYEEEKGENERIIKRRRSKKGKKGVEKGQEVESRK